MIALGPPTSAAKQSTNSIPIVTAFSGDPVGMGLVSNLARPGGKSHRLLLHVDGPGGEASRADASVRCEIVEHCCALQPGRALDKVRDGANRGRGPRDRREADAIG